MIRTSLSTLCMAALAFGLLSGCAGAPKPEPSPTASTAAAAPTPTPEPTRELPEIEATVVAGAVADGTPASVSGSGPTQIDYTVQDGIAVVVTLDCSACDGLVTVTNPDRMSPLGEAEAPLTGSYLENVFTADDPGASLLLYAAGNWTVRLESWNDIPSTSGPQSGTGSRVLYLADATTSIDVSYQPADSDDTISVRVFTVAGTPLVFGDEVAFTESFDTQLPGVIAVATNGSWTITPR